LSAVPQLTEHFPKFLQEENDTSFLMEYVNGTELSKLYFEGLLQPQALAHLLETVHEIHQHRFDDGSGVSQHDVFDHYMVKFEKRAARKGDFPFTDFERICMSFLYYFSGSTSSLDNVCDIGVHKISCYVSMGYILEA